MIFSEPQKDILHSPRALNLFLAGKGSGKSHLAGIITAGMIGRFPECRGFIGANTYEQVNTSTLVRVFAVWRELNITEYTNDNKQGCYVVGKQPPEHFVKFEKYINYSSIISFDNGAIIYIGSLDNAKAHEGKEFAYAILDETKDSKEQDVKDTILTRLRQKGLTLECGKEFNPLYILTSPAKVEWINKWFELDKYIDEINSLIYSETTYFKLETTNKRAVISSTYHNKANLPENYFDIIRESNSEENYKTIIYANPFGRSGGEYYGSFDRKKHVGMAKYREDLPIHISFDFNLVPYNPAGIYQIERINDRYQVRMIDEIALKAPSNSVEHVCERIIQVFGKHRAGVFLYGDSTGRSGSIANREQRSNWDTVYFKLRSMITEKSKRVPRMNKSNKVRREAINLILEGKKPIDLLFDENCKLMINDLLYCKEDADGVKNKKTVKDEAGNSYQPYGHFGDLMEYFVCECFEKVLF